MLIFFFKQKKSENYQTRFTALAEASIEIATFQASLREDLPVSESKMPGEVRYSFIHTYSISKTEFKCAKNDKKIIRWFQTGTTLAHSLPEHRK